MNAQDIPAPLQVEADYIVREMDDSGNEACDRFVEASDHASVYHLTAWCGLVKNVFGHETRYLYAEGPDNEIIGVLPMVRLKSWLFGDYIVSMPFFNYGGAVGNNKEIEASLMSSAVSIAEKINTNHIEFRDSESRGKVYPVRTDKITMILDLPETQEELWADLGAKRRAQIKRPLREGVVVKNGGSELLDDFYHVFSRNMRDLGTPVYSKIFFSEILKTFPDKTQIIIVYHEGNPVGSGFLIGFRQQLEIPWASTLREVNSLGINMLMYWEVLKYAIKSGYKSFDFGRCSVDSGTWRFKKQWGAKPRQLYWHYWLRNSGNIPQLNPSNPKYQLAIKAWQRLPLVVANWLGPKLIKNLP